MSRDVGDVIGAALGRAARDAAQTVTTQRKRANGLSGMKGLAAGAGIATLAPLATKGAGKLVRNRLSNGKAPVKHAGEKFGEGVKSAIGGTTGGAAGVAKTLLPGGKGKDEKEQKGVPGVGKGRRMPVQQAVDVAAPISTVYNQWTQFEEWPRFMHRLQRVTQEDDSHVSFKTKIWGVSKQFKAEIVEQRPDERIKWRVTEGVSHTGVVTFHQLSDRLTRVDVNIDVQPGSLIEKAGRGMRHVKRAVRADLARFKAYVDMEEHETGAWRGEIAKGKVKSSSQKRAQATSRPRASTTRARGAGNGRGRTSGRKAQSQS